MKLTHSYKNEPTVDGLRTSLRQSVATFVNRYADSFEALARTGNPFGGNWLPARSHSAGAETAGLTEKQLAQVQQQVSELTQSIALLSDEVNKLSSQTAGTPDWSSTHGGKSANRTNERGVNRHRAGGKA